MIPPRGEGEGGEEAGGVLRLQRERGPADGLAVSISSTVCGEDVTADSRSCLSLFKVVEKKYSLSPFPPQEWDYLLLS